MFLPWFPPKNSETYSSSWIASSLIIWFIWHTTISKSIIFSFFISKSTFKRVIESGPPETPITILSPSSIKLYFSIISILDETETSFTLKNIDDENEYKIIEEYLEKINNEVGEN